jgi:hypothetical protein
MKRVIAIGDPGALDAQPLDGVTGASTFDFDPTRAVEVLTRMKTATDGPIALDGTDWAQAAMGTLLQAEFLAADAGVVPWFTLPTGEKGVLTVGAARERIDDAPEDVRTIYLATHGIVRATHAQARPWDGHTPTLSGLAIDELGNPTIVIAVTVVAIAAIIGTAWYLTSRSSIEVEGRNVRTTALAADVAALARDQLAKNGSIDPGVWDVFKSIADAESGHAIAIPLILGGIALAGVGGALAWRRWRKHEARDE